MEADVLKRRRFFMAGCSSKRPCKSDSTWPTENGDFLPGDGRDSFSNLPHDFINLAWVQGGRLIFQLAPPCDQNFVPATYLNGISSNLIDHCFPFFEIHRHSFSISAVTAKSACLLICSAFVLHPPRALRCNRWCGTYRRWKSLNPASHFPVSPPNTDRMDNLVRWGNPVLLREDNRGCRPI